MLSYLKDIFNVKESNVSKENISDDHKLQIAACALLIEIATADDNFSDSEKTEIVELMRSRFNLSEKEVEQLIKKSEEEIKDSVSLYEFTDILNKNLNFEEKYQIIKYLWEIAYADGNLDNYEDYYIKKICGNFHFHHKDRIAAKLEVKEKLNINTKQ